MPAPFISKLTHRGTLPCIAGPGHIPKGEQDNAADSESSGRSEELNRVYGQADNRWRTLKT